jgi:beta-galactosidase
VDRDKYSELKLIANFLKVSPSYLVTTPQNLTVGVYTDSTDLTVTPLLGNGTGWSSFYVIRHNDETSLESTSYKLTIPTSTGNVTIPQISGSLTLNGRDSKVHPVDYEFAGNHLVYSSAEIFTWKQFGRESVLVLYGGAGEQHELEIIASGGTKCRILAGHASTKDTKSSVVINWKVSSTRQIVQIGDLQILLLGKIGLRCFI